MADIFIFTATRPDVPDTASVIRLLRAGLSDPTIGPDLTRFPVVRLKRETTWTTRDEQTAVTIVETAPATSPALTAQAQIDEWPIPMRALVGALVDELNQLRALLALPARTDADLTAAVKTRTTTVMPATVRTRP